MTHSTKSQLRWGMLARRLTTVLDQEDAAERAGLSPFERITCPLHRRWLHECIASPVHVVPVAGYRWCRECSASATVSVDELLQDVRVACPRCGRTPHAIASEQIVRTCRASMVAAHGARNVLAVAPARAA
jgi:hypothetical protein